jgi:hypothetical protein
MAIYLLYLLIYSSFKNTISISDNQASNDRLMVTNWKRCGRKRSWPNLRYYAGIFLARLRKTIKTCQASQSPGQVFNWGPLEYESGGLTTRMQHSKSRKTTEVTNLSYSE